MTRIPVDRQDAYAPRRRVAAPARVTRVESPCRQHVRIEATVRGFPDSQPGQFLELLCDEDPAGSGPSVHWWLDGQPLAIRDAAILRRTAYLRRPFSIADHWADADGTQHLVVISRNIGVGTGWLEGLRAGDVLNMTGPLGRPFRVPEEPRPLLLIGGGVGIPPLLYLVRRLKELGRPEPLVIFGATTRDLFPVGLCCDPPTSAAAPSACLRLPADAAYPGLVTTDDGTLGVRGLVTDALEAWAAARDPGGPTPLVLACGPEGMLRAVARATRRLGFDCQLCIERLMGCGLGTCLSCIVRVVDEGRPEGWRWGLACTEGPVFERDALADAD